MYSTIWSNSCASNSKKIKRKGSRTYETLMWTLLKNPPFVWFLTNPWVRWLTARFLCPPPSVFLLAQSWQGSVAKKNLTERGQILGCSHWVMLGILWCLFISMLSSNVPCKHSPFGLCAILCFHLSSNGSFELGWVSLLSSSIAEVPLCTLNMLLKWHRLDHLHYIL